MHIPPLYNTVMSRAVTSVRKTLVIYERLLDINWSLIFAVLEENHCFQDDLTFFSKIFQKYPSRESENYEGSHSKYISLNS